MSHWKKFASNVLEDINKEILAKATADMGIGFDEKIKHISNTWGNESVSAGLTKDGRPIALGFNFKNRNGKITLELSGDFFGTGLDERTFIDTLSQNYQKYKTIDALEQQGWVVDSVEFNKKNEIEIEAYQWA